MPSQPDIAQVLTYEIRKEIADRYFGFRKVIEEDSDELAAGVRRSVSIEELICLDLVRIYILLGDYRLIQEFFSIVGLEEEIFYDPYLLESPSIRARLLGGVTTHGLTRSGRYKNLLFDLYEALAGHVSLYREKYVALIDEREVIRQEIELFYEKNDLSDIMGFMRQFDQNELPGHMAAAKEIGRDADLEKKMRLVPPPPIEKELPLIPPMPPLATVKRALKKLAEKAFKGSVAG